MILIGSQALKFHIKLNRKPKDYDIICTHDEYIKWIKRRTDVIECYPINNGKKIIVKTISDIYEFEIAWDGTTAKLLLNNDWKNFYSVELSFSLGEEVEIPTLNQLYTIKMSHRFLKNSPHFLKTMRDIQLMKTNGAHIPEIYNEWFKQREKETYNYSHPNLNQNKSEFFDKNSGVEYIYDHDTIHLAMAHMCKPAYVFFKDDEKEVMCSKKKFFEQPLNVQLFSVLEETYVLALERSQIPFINKVDPLKSFKIALEKVCTSISSGWWREFAYDHYDQVLEMYDEKYVDKFWKAVNEGIVKKL